MWTRFVILESARLQCVPISAYMPSGKKSSNTNRKLGLRSIRNSVSVPVCPPESTDYDKLIFTL